MGWEMPSYTLTGDFGVDERHGTKAFIRDGDSVCRTTSAFVVSDVIVIGISKVRRNDETRIRACCVHGPRP